LSPENKKKHLFLAFDPAFSGAQPREDGPKGCTAHPNRPRCSRLSSARESSKVGELGKKKGQRHFGGNPVHRRDEGKFWGRAKGGGDVWGGRRWAQPTGGQGAPAGTSRNLGRGITLAPRGGGGRRGFYGGRHDLAVGQGPPPENREGAPGGEAPTVISGRVD